MANRAYQYETSPRKYEPEYEHRASKSRKAKSSVKKKKVAKRDIKAEKKAKLKFKMLATINLILLLGILFVIMYRSSLIAQNFSQIQGLQAKVADLEKENDQLEISIQNSMNIDNIEQSAKELLGMQKLSSKQTVYLNLPKKDYVEPSTEEIILEENTGIVSKVIEFIKNLF